MKGKADKDAFLNLNVEGSGWTFMFFNDGVPVKADLSNNTLSGSDLNNRVTEADLKTDAMYQQYNAFIDEISALPEEEQDAKMPEYREWFNKLRDCYLGVVEDNKDNLVPVAFIRTILSMAGPDKFNELVYEEVEHPGTWFLWGFWNHSPVQFSSVAQACPTLCNPMNRSTSGFPVHHQLLESTQTHVH